MVFDELEAPAPRPALEFTAVSEELGERVFGDGCSPNRVVIDPIDGSLNARRTLPSFALSVAVADGPTMADVSFGFVHDFGAVEDFVRGAGLRGDPQRPSGQRARARATGSRWSGSSPPSPS